MNYYIAEILKEFPFQFKLLVEDENEKRYNFFVTKEELEVALNLEEGTLPESGADYDMDSILEGARLVMEKQLESEDLYLEPQKIVGYAFLRKNGLYHNISKCIVQNPAMFTKKNNYLNYSPIFG